MEHLAQNAPSSTFNSQQMGQDAGRNEHARELSRGESGSAQGARANALHAALQSPTRSKAPQPSATLLPPVDIFEDESGFTVIADMPGVSREALTVRVTGENLVIEGTASVPADGEVELLYGEVSNPQYRRSFTLSRELDPTKIEAKLNNGVLRLTIPKAEEAKPRRIQVNVG